MTQPAEPDIIQHYSEILGPLGALPTGWIAIQLDNMVEDYGKANVIYGLQQAASYKKTSLRYVEAVIKNGLERGKITKERKPEQYAEDWQSREISGDSYASWND